VGLLDRLKERLSRTRTALSDRISGLFRGGRPIDEALLGELESMLYSADLGPVAAEVVEEIGRLHRRGEVKGEEDVRTQLRKLLLARLAGTHGEIDVREKPTVILVVGVNGSGKTTTIAKLAHRIQSKGKRVLLGAGDTFRAAAADQLEIWAQRNGAEIVRAKPGSDPASVAFEAVDAAVARGMDAVLVDTAGRLHTQKNLMDELQKVRRVIARRLPGAPHETLLVLDASQGQNALAQALKFHERLGVTGLAITKLDGTAKGGILLAIARELELPIRFVALGEGVDDLEEFRASEFVRALIGERAA